MEGITIHIVPRPGSPSPDNERPMKKQKTEGASKPVLSTLEGLILHGEYLIPKTSLVGTWRKEPWFKKLTVLPQLPKIGNNEISPFPVFQENETYLQIPKFLGLTWLGYPERDQRSLGAPLTHPFQFLGDLSNSVERPQQQAKDACVKQLCDTGGALLVLPCGFGKTVVSLAIAAAMKRKTLVVVHSVELAHQWGERVTQFLGLTPGSIQGDTWDVEPSVVVGMLQTLVRRQPDLSLFGTCIVDEAHHVAARSFSQLMPLVTSRYILGLSATPNRKDGLKKVLLWTLGPVAFEAARNDSDSPNVMRCIVTEGKRKVLTYKNGEVGRSKMITWLTEDSSRNAFIVHMLNSVLQKNSRRKVLMLTDRREQVMGLLQTLTTASSWTCGKLLGGMKQEDIETQKEAQVLLSTYHFCSEGFDLPRLDTLFLLSPRSDIEQSVGRVLRKHPEKQKPLIFDFVDNFSVFESQSLKRVAYFERLGCFIKTYEQLELLKIK